MIKDENLNFEKIGSHRFTFNGNIIPEIGGESISNPNIAIMELVKNSFDAEADSVHIELKDIEKRNASIKITDNGSGMDPSAIKDNFMDIGSPHKREIDRTPEYERIPVGAKGIGRFASNGLGSLMTLTTFPKNELSGNQLIFNWAEFTKKNKATDIDIISSKFKKKKGDKGTIIKIEKLKHVWNDNEKLESLLRDLNLLTNPLDQPKKFKIKTDFSKEVTDLPKLNKKWLDLAVYRLKIKFSKKKKISYEFYKCGKKIRTDEYELDKNLLCGDACFDLYFYYKNIKTWKERTGKEITQKEISNINNFLKHYSGIKLYRDKFRVKPYGDYGADWINLDKWSRDNPSMVPGNTQVFGIVTVGRETNPDIIDTTTREGVINNENFFDLRTFVTTGIELFVDIRSDMEAEKAKARKSKTKKKLKVVKPKVDDSSSAVKKKDFIDAKGNYPTNHYDQLLFEINECYDKNYPNATFALSRKIIENLVYHVLEKKFSKQVSLWYDTGNKRNLQLKDLISNLYSERSKFKQNVKDSIEQFNSDVGTFRNDVNKAMHRNQTYLSDTGELKKYKINKLVQLLLEIFNKM